MHESSWQPLKLAVCDDESTDRVRIAEMARSILKQEGIKADITCFESGTALLETIHKGAVFQILLLDVLMEELNGMALASALRKQGSDSSIIFISCNREMAMQGYEVAALRYLAKPLDVQKLREALLYCYQVQKPQREVLLPTAKGQSRVDIASLVYAETWERGVRLTLTTGQLTTNLKISELAAMLPTHQYVYCHRTVLVNLAFVASIRYCELELKNGTILPISKYRLTEIKSQLLRYLSS